MWASCLKGKPGFQIQDHVDVPLRFAHSDIFGLGIMQFLLNLHLEAPAFLLVRRKNSWSEIHGPEWELEHFECLTGNLQMIWEKSEGLEI